MFFNCNSLKYIDISGLKSKSEVEIFNSLPDNCEIKINTLSNNKFFTIPTSCKIKF